MVVVIGMVERNHDERMVVPPEFVVGDGDRGEVGV